MERSNNFALFNDEIALLNLRYSVTIYLQILTQSIIAVTNKERHRLTITSHISLTFCQVGVL